MVTEFSSHCLLGLSWRVPNSPVFLEMLESSICGGLLAPRWTEVSDSSRKGHSQAWICAQPRELCPFQLSVTGLITSLWQVGCSDDCRGSVCCPALNLVMLVFLNNVGKTIKYKLWYYAAVLCSALDQCCYKLLWGASRPLSCILSLFKINIFITILLPQRILLVLLLLAPSRKCLTDLPFVKAHWSFVALKCAAFSP